MDVESTRALAHQINEADFELVRAVRVLVVDLDHSAEGVGPAAHHKILARDHGMAEVAPWRHRAHQMLLDW
eukprot:CAMPEP_0182569676 /NCGR_PEP_ID=MMETSP1324-20130603/10232_1 /TAXON_ID=236786 /ORGANISM="Florenciella sp., Strain RCC1587" /LENGTH=70 /DNA_ID=CAMNT_0024783979 /DNA_START=392 /DNA_END=601 /DNA_ORIENTATION=-